MDEIGGGCDTFSGRREINAGYWLENLKRPFGGTRCRWEENKMDLK
jgi:hypothetical protein